MILICTTVYTYNIFLTHLEEEKLLREKQFVFAFYSLKLPSKSYATAAASKHHHVFAPELYCANLFIFFFSTVATFFFVLEKLRQYKRLSCFSFAMNKKVGNSLNGKKPDESLGNVKGKADRGRWK